MKSSRRVHVGGRGPQMHTMRWQAVFTPAFSATASPRTELSATAKPSHICGAIPESTNVINVLHSVFSPRMWCSNIITTSASRHRIPIETPQDRHDGMDHPNAIPAQRGDFRPGIGFAKRWMVYKGIVFCCYIIQ